MERLGNPEELPKAIMFRTALASTISQIGWWSAVTIGFLHRHINDYFSWPPNQWVIMATVLILISIAVVIGELVTRPREVLAKQEAN